MNITDPDLIVDDPGPQDKEKWLSAWLKRVSRKITQLWPKERFWRITQSLISFGGWTLGAIALIVIWLVGYISVHHSVDIHGFLNVQDQSFREEFGCDPVSGVDKELYHKCIAELVQKHLKGYDKQVEELQLRCEKLSENPQTGNYWYSRSYGANDFLNHHGLPQLFVAENTVGFLGSFNWGSPDYSSAQENRELATQLKEMLNRREYAYQLARANGFSD